MESSPIISALNCENCLELLQGKPKFNICNQLYKEGKKNSGFKFLPTTKACLGTADERFKMLLDYRHNIFLKARNQCSGSRAVNFWDSRIPDPDPRGMDPVPAPDPDPSIIKQK